MMRISLQGVLLAFSALLACSSRMGPTAPAGAAGQGGQAAAAGGSSAGTGAAGASTAGSGVTAGASGSAGTSGSGGSTSGAASACARQDPFLKASGIELKNDRGSGDVVVLRGANLGGWLLTEPWMSPIGEMKDDYTLNQTLVDRFGEATADELLGKYRAAWMQPADFENLAALGMNAVRIPFSVYHTMNADGSIRADAFEELDYAVSEAWKHCIYSILDLHGAPGGASEWASSGKEGPAELFTSEAHQARAVDLWKAVAARYKDNPAVAGYDLVNEPHGGESVTNQERWELQDKLYQAVRSVDSEHVIFIEAIWWLADLPHPAEYGWNNVVYECHHYEGFGETWKQTDEAAQKAGADAKVDDFIAHQHYGVPFFLGEFNFFQPEEAWNYGIELWDQAGISWTTWSYRASVNGAAATNSWGVYNPIEPRPPEPNLSSDSAQDIAGKWEAYTSEKFALNPMLQEALAMPRVLRDTYTALAGQTLTVAAPGVLGNDTHVVAGVTLSAELTAQPGHGSVVLNPDGSFTYVPDGGFSGQDSFSYRAFDGRLTSGSPAVVALTVE